MTEIRPHRLLVRIIRSSSEHSPYQTNLSEAETLCDSDTLARGMHRIHDEVHKRIFARRKHVIVQYNCATIIVKPNILGGNLLVVSNLN